MKSFDHRTEQRVIRKGSVAGLEASPRVGSGIHSVLGSGADGLADRDAAGTELRSNLPGLTSHPEDS